MLANSIPKAGTHLLAALLNELPDMRFSGHHHGLAAFRSTPLGDWSYTDSDLDLAKVRSVLKRVRDGQYLTAHFPYTPGLETVVADLEYRHVVMIRDPRDIVVSDAIYMARTRRHRHYERFHAFESLSDAIMATITGFEADGALPGLESIGDRIRNYAGWLDRPDVIVCRFEDLIGLQGGGSTDIQRRAIEAIAAHVQRPLSPRQLSRVCAAVWSPSSSTFRRGMVGDWRRAFTSAHVEAFQIAVGPLVTLFGYEEGQCWT